MFEKKICQKKKRVIFVINYPEKKTLTKRYFLFQVNFSLLNNFFNFINKKKKILKNDFFFIQDFFSNQINIYDCEVRVRFLHGYFSTCMSIAYTRWRY